MADAASEVTNRYLEANYAPVSEEVTAFDLPVIGEIPRELRAATCATDPIRPRRSIPPAITGSSATAWCTAFA